MDTPPSENPPPVTTGRTLAEIIDVSSEAPPPVRPRRSGGLFVTFLLGAVVGSAVTYGLLSAAGVALPDPTLNPGAVSSDPALPVPEATTDELADLNGLWPARHLVLTIDEARPSDETLELLGAFKPGAVRIRTDLIADPASMRELTTVLKRAVGRNGLPLILAADSGNPNPLADGPPPAYFSLGAVGDPSTVTAAGASFATAARARGFEGIFAPWTSLVAAGQAAPTTTWTADPAQSASLVLAYIDGVQSEGLLPLAMAFPGMGLAQPGAPGTYSIAEQELRLIASHMVPLREAAAGGVPGILVTHTNVPVLDKRFPDRPASLSPTLLGGIVRGKWRYEGVLIADDLAPLAAAQNKPVEELFVQALAAGCDAVVLSGADRTTMRRICAALVALADAGGLDPTALDTSKRRLGQWQDTLAAYEQRAKQAVPAVQPEQTELLRHTVQPGETLIGVARQYNVRVSDIKSWNGLADSMLAAGQKLNIYLDKAESAPVSAPAPDAQEEALEAISAPVEPEAVSAAPEPEPAKEVPAEKAEDKKEEKAKAEEKKEAEKKKAEDKAKVEEKKEEAKPEPAAPIEVPTPEPVPSPVPEAAAAPVDQAPPASPLVPVDTAATPEPAPAMEATEAAPAPPAPAPLKDGKFHVWQEGDNLDVIATQYGVTVDQLKEWNLLNVAPPTNGMDLVVVAPPGAEKKSAAEGGDKPTTTHTVKTGETLHRIAIQYGASKEALVKLNNLERADLIWVGQKLKVPAK
jgi:LysM repeat protein